MGLMDFLSSKYTPKDFQEKTAKQVIEEMDMKKLDAEILTMIENEKEIKIPEDVINAIKMLLDLKKGKMTIYEKCYNKTTGHAAHANASHAAHANATHAAHAKPVSLVPKHNPIAMAPMQKGGRRRKTKKGKKRGKKTYKKRKAY
jgi:hypothetical protein